MPAHATTTTLLPLASPLRRPRVARAVTIALGVLLLVASLIICAVVAGLGSEATRVFLTGQYIDQPGHRYLQPGLFQALALEGLPFNAWDLFVNGGFVGWNVKATQIGQAWCVRGCNNADAY